MRVDPTKKIVLNEGRSVGSKNFQYGGFPRILKENEEEGNWEEFIGLVNQAQRSYFNSLPGVSGKKIMPANIDKMLTSFINDPSEAGDNVTDDLIQAGFPVEMIGRAAKIRRKSIMQQKETQGMHDPTLGGSYRPRHDPNASAAD